MRFADASAYEIMWSETVVVEIGALDNPRQSRNRRSRPMPELHDLIVRPVVTEKSSAAYGARKEYAFRVHSDATKPQIKAAIETLFKVSVTDVRTMVMRAKRRTYGRYQGRRPSWKKAIVTLKEGDAIEVFEAKWESDSFGR